VDEHINVQADFFADAGELGDPDISGCANTQQFVDRLFFGTVIGILKDGPLFSRDLLACVAEFLFFGSQNIELLETGCELGKLGLDRIKSLSVRIGFGRFGRNYSDLASCSGNNLLGRTPNT
jgi:hypothetical protein